MMTTENGEDNNKAEELFNWRMFSFLVGMQTKYSGYSSFSAITLLASAFCSHFLREARTISPMTVNFGPYSVANFK